ncbi:MULTISPECIES: 5'-methylthioadenosine/adenosylhomocysteine nucleosidase [unclassified Paenibacillus]|uniref:5'-methylthioadenosine/adenosylhomocysteine nucleosidase n=1 Tax=unclassified Paenibacillus TaxID=185978 RepID=UPI001AE5A7E2|nr:MULTISPECIES: 5'-methylthioadenosine/adenosylhomocysteine nucleosidase [unclassified Paenibacillus]MBP1156133.1 adenosylhomocysteine nucleosidase [Paenibacillus sp. PvP091]MBP1168481.1 adenosylhomocysteine nucleosidase [Paenibacillus sp. PvR098]MBP2439509.1 adenosylhomocysteine nucleosidase [Paenibacillus sp. PvP052]
MAYSKIGIIGAMKEEIELFHNHMDQVSESVKAGIVFYEGRFHGRQIVLCKSGVGKVNAAITTQILIDTYGVESIVFTGVAGAVDPELNVGDIVVSTECLQHDMDVTALGFPRGTIPYEATSLFTADERLRTLAVEASVELFGGRVKEGRVLSGDQFIASRETVAQLYSELGGACTEMEGAAVAQACYMNGIPFVVIRSMSDKADGSAHVNFAEFTVQASENSYRIVDQILKRLQ